MWQTIFLIVIGVAVVLVIVAESGDNTRSSASHDTSRASNISGAGDTSGTAGNGGADGNGTAVVARAPEISGVGLPAAVALLAGGVALIAARAGTGKAGARATWGSDENTP